nr:undecaprenyldiphospho-muramoylpentapeptide beta-N-acetylglucosaminyltransferase [Thiocapsa imhoffii]
MAGGTGGHVFPALAVAERLREQGMEVFWLGTSRGMESRLVPAHGFDLECIRISGLRGQGIAPVLGAPFKVGAAMIAASRILRRRAASVVLGMGGFVAGPGGVAARLQGVPLVIHEQNFVPGMTNQWLARIATRVFEAFPGSFPAARGAEASGNPVRQTILALPPPKARWERRRAADGAPHLLVLGGSLGAQVLNEQIPQALAALAVEQRPRVRHQAGERTLAIAQSAYREAGVAADVTPFIDDMAEAYAWADLVVCRAGALTVSELAAAGIASVLVPYPHAVDDHQVGNARYLADIGAAELIVQADLDTADLSRRLAALCADPDRLLRMGEAARTRARVDAVERIAAACWELALR